jgi:hypothetical protein
MQLLVLVLLARLAGATAAAASDHPSAFDTRNAFTGYQAILSMKST